MELNELVRRIGGEHWRLIVGCIVAAVAASMLLGGGTMMYTASARLVLDTQDPQSRPASVAIADTAKAIGTSPAQVRAALAAAHVRDRDAFDIARHHVDIQALGESAVLQLSVTDRSPTVAARIANALAHRVIRTRLAVTRGQIEATLAGLETTVDDLTRRISKDDILIDALGAKLASASPGLRARTLQARRDNAVRARAYLAQRRAVIESERDSLLATDALRPNPVVISPAAVPLAPTASHRFQIVILGVLLGLVAGVGLAALIETLTPTLVGANVLARELDTPLLGMLSREPAGAANVGQSRPIALRVRLAAEAAGVRTVALACAGRAVDLRRLAEELNLPHATELVPALEARSAARGGAGIRHLPEYSDSGKLPFRVTPFELESWLPSGIDASGLVLVAPEKLKLAELLDAVNLRRVAAVPLLGLIAYTPAAPRLWQRPRRFPWLEPGGVTLVRSWLRPAVLHAVGDELVGLKAKLRGLPSTLRRPSRSSDDDSPEGLS